MSDRGRRRNDDHYDDAYYDERRPRRHRSLSRKMMDKLEDAMGSLGIDSSGTREDARLPSKRSSRHRDHLRSWGRDRNRDSGYYSHNHSQSNRSRQQRAYSVSPARTRTRGRDISGDKGRLDRGVKAAIDAAAVEAFRLRNEPGSWTAGAKAERIATAAISAGVIGAAAADKTAGGHDKSKLGTIGSAIGGLVVNRVVNGPRRDVR